MNRIVTHSKVAPDGTVTVQLPIEYAGKQVEVTIQKLAPLVEMSQEEWNARISELAGKWQGDFEEIDEGPIQEREPFD